MSDIDISEDVKQEIQEYLPEYDTKLIEELNIKPLEIAFIYYYIEANFKEADAYQKAFQEDNKAMARYKAKRLLKRPEIQEALNRILGEVWRESVRKLPHQVMESYQKVLDMDVSDYYDDDGMAKPLSEIPLERRKMIINVEYVMNSKTGMVYPRYDLPDKKESLAALFSLIKLHKELIGDDSDKGNTSEAAKKRDEIFNSVEKIEAETLDSVIKIE